MAVADSTTPRMIAILVRLFQRRQRPITNTRSQAMLALDGPAAGFPPRDTRLVRAELRRANARAGARLAGNRGRRARPDPGADRFGQDARGLPLRHRPTYRASRRRPPAPLRLAAQGAELRRRAEPARPARRPP